MARGMDGAPLSQVSIFMEDANDRSFIGVKDNSRSDSIESCELMVIDVSHIDLAVSLMEHAGVRVKSLQGHHWLPCPPLEWFC